MTSTKRKSLLFWVDMEMTGLDPDKEGIIEIASVLTDWDLHVIENGPHMVIHQPEKLLKKMDEWNQKQHKKSGLIEEVRTSKNTVKQAEKQTLEFVKKFCDPKRVFLSGNAVHHDRRFMMKYMPKLSDYLHYRHIDVSSIKALVQYWYPKAKETPKKTDTHRALSDIHESIDELRYYRAHYFVKREA